MKRVASQKILPKLGKVLWNSLLIFTRKRNGSNASCVFTGVSLQSFQKEESKNLPPGSSKKAEKKRSSIMISPASTGVLYRPIIPWKGTCGKSEEEQDLLELSPAGNSY